MMILTTILSMYSNAILKQPPSHKLSALSDVGQHVRSLEEFRKEGHMAFQHCSVNRDLKLDMLY